jgi:hypothetical protein
VERPYIDHLEAVAQFDVAELKRKDAEYGGSWKKRGGIGAFMNLVRKWDRLDEQVSRAERQGRRGIKYDIFEHITHDASAESVLDSLRDLRRYCMLVEAEMVARGATKMPGAGLPRARTLDPEAGKEHHGVFPPPARPTMPPARPSTQQRVPRAGYALVGTGIHTIEIRRELNKKEYDDMGDDLKRWYVFDEDENKYKVPQWVDGQTPHGFNAEEERRPSDR